MTNKQNKKVGLNDKKGFKFIRFYFFQIIKAIVWIILAMIPYNFTVNYASNIALSQNVSNSQMYVADTGLQVFVIASGVLMAAVVIKIFRMNWSYKKHLAGRSDESK